MQESLERMYVTYDNMILHNLYNPKRCIDIPACIFPLTIGGHCCNFTFFIIYLVEIRKIISTFAN